MSLPPQLAWIDHDSTARERTLRILSLFQEKESRDELGLVRDSFADQLFPGTSTIKTRLCYMLFETKTVRVIDTISLPDIPLSSWLTSALTPAVCIANGERTRYKLIAPMGLALTVIKQKPSFW